MTGSNQNKKKTDANGKKLKKKIDRELAKSIGATDTKKYLMSINPYLLGLADPFNVHGVKIPDMVSYPSSTFAVVHRDVLTVNSNGVALIVFGYAALNASIAAGGLVPVAYYAAPPETPKFFGSNNNGKSDPYYPERGKVRTHHRLEPNNVGLTSSNSYTVGMKNSTGSTESNLFTTGTGAVQAFQFQQWSYPGTSGIPSLYDKVRIVSAGLAVNYTGVLTTAKGVTTVAFAPRRSYLRTKVDSGTSVTIGMIQSLPGARIVPNNNLQGASVFYKPQDSLSLAYVDEQELYDNLDTQETDFPVPALGGELYAVVTGATAGDTIQVTAIFNYEGIPKTSDLNLVSTSPSQSDPIALSHALNTVQSIPSSVGSTSEAQGLVSGKTQIQDVGSLTSSSITHTAHEDNKRLAPSQQSTMFEKIIDKGLGAIGSLGEQAIERLPALLMSAL